jgi:antitoxin CcdA
MGKTELKVEIDANLLERARAAGLDLDGLTEAALRRAVDHLSADDRARKWAEDNADALQAHRERIEKFGVFGDDMRTW